MRLIRLTLEVDEVDDVATSVDDIYKVKRNNAVSVMGEVDEDGEANTLKGRRGRQGRPY